MIEALAQKIVSITHPAAIYDNASLATTSVDTKDWDWATIVVDVGATDIAMTALKLQESDDDGSSDAYADISDSVYGGTGNPALPTAATGDNKLYAIQVDLRGRKRYLDLVATFGDGTSGGYASAFAILSRGKAAPNSATERGFAAEAFC